MSVEIAALYIYPIKSCAGFAVPHAALDALGLEHDRRWMVVRDRIEPAADGTAWAEKLSQRELPALARIRTRIEGETLVVRAPDMADFHTPLTGESDLPARRVHVDLFNGECIGVDQGETAARWFSRALGTPVRLLRMADGTGRAVDARYAAQPALASFSDGFPILFTSVEGLDDLNARLVERGSEPLDMRRFRPNVVLRGGGAFVEDGWSRVAIAGIAFEVVKPCARCPITTVDPDLGAIVNKAEPLATLATYRRSPQGKVMFGQNVIHRGTGVLRVGDAVQVVERREPLFA